MKLEQNEFTVKSLIAFLKKKYSTKVTGKPFNSSDIAQYEMRGYLPYRYGGQKIVGKTIQGVKIIVLSDTVMKELPRKQKVNETKIS